MHRTEASGIEQKVEAAASMTEDELIAEAAKETGKFVAYGNSSRIVDAMEGFVAKYGTQLTCPPAMQPHPNRPIQKSLP